MHALRARARNGALGLFLVVVTLGVTTAASAAPFIFNVKANRWGLYVAGSTLYDGNGPYAQGSLTGSNPASVTLPAQWLISGPYTYTASGLTGYPYFAATVYRTIGAGNFAESFFVPSASFTAMRDEAAYPNNYPLGVYPQAYVNIKVGSKGFGGPMALNREETYFGLYNGGVGTSTLFVTNTVTIHDNVGASAGDRCCAFESRTLLTANGLPNGPVTGVVWGWNPIFAHLTGTASIYAPTGDISHVGTYKGSDARNAAGTSGTLTLIAPGLATSFNIGGNTLPAKDMSLEMSSVVNVVRQVLQTTIVPVPEPGQLTLLLAGGASLLVLAWRSRNR